MSVTLKYNYESNFLKCYNADTIFLNFNFKDLQFCKKNYLKETCLSRLRVLDVPISMTLTKPKCAHPSFENCSFPAQALTQCCQVWSCSKRNRQKYKFLEFNKLHGSVYGLNDTGANLAPILETIEYINIIRFFLFIQPAVQLMLRLNKFRQENLQKRKM